MKAHSAGSGWRWSSRSGWWGSIRRGFRESRAEGQGSRVPGLHTSSRAAQRALVLTPFPPLQQVGEGALPSALVDRAGQCLGRQLCILDADHPNAVILQYRPPIPVQQSPGGIIMRWPIQFDRQFQFVAVEIHDKPVQRPLPSELETEAAPIPE